MLTPTLRQGARRSAFWVAAAIFLVLVAFGALLLTGAAQDTEPLSPESPTPDGAMALAEVLRQEGVDVEITESLDATASAVSSNGSGDVTILLNDVADLLTTEQRDQILDLTDDLIVIAPSFRALEDLSPSVVSAGEPDDDTLPADCTLPAAEAAGEISPGGTSYRLDGEEDEGADACFRSDSAGADEAFSVVEVQNSGTSVTVVGATAALTNGEINDYGNAAFALTLLGENETLLWYTPSLADVPDAVDPAALTPGWVTPSILLLVITTVAAAIWRGRRFGPLIVENLPVVVRASETMEGRARLYQRGSARLRALDALRIGAIARVATLCGLPQSASVEELVLAASAALGSDPRVVRGLLVDSVPATDAELVQLSDALLELERNLAAAVRP